MKNCHYLKGRPKYSRVLRPQDLVSLELTSPVPTENLVWSPENKFTLVLEADLSDSIAAKFPGFRSLPILGVETPSIDASGPSQDQGSGEGNLDDSEDDESDDVTSSTLDDDPDA